MKYRIQTLVISLLFSIMAWAQDFGSLSNEFRNPPLTARPGVYWYFMDGNFSREGVTKDLEAMRDQGIGYVVFLEVNVGVPRGNVDFMSQEWLDNFKYTVAECERLDIQMILGIGPGWTGSGGPWVKGEQSMRHLMSTTTILDGGAHVNVKLPVPAPNPPFFGEGAFTPEMKVHWNNYYEDVAVLAFPDKEVGSMLADVQEKALFIRAPFSSQPGVKQYLPAPVTNGMATKGVNPKEVIDVTPYMDADGTLSWDAPAGKWRVMRFGMRNNGAATRPAPIPGVGMECDKFSREALYAHLNEFAGKLIDLVGTDKDKFGGLKFLHMDSWEMGAQNWGDDFREEFQRRRGYDPLPYYPVYAGVAMGDSVLSERFLWDVRKTAQELVIENHALAVKEYAHERGLSLSIEPYDMNPTADLELGAVADYPMCEFWSDGFGFKTLFAAGEGTSAAHLIGQPVVPAESFTAENDGYRQYPGRMKNQTDWALASGINRLLYHTFQHQCLPDSLRPGMTMGPYGVHWDRNQTWWPMASGYHTYVARCQHMLQQGRTVADILYLVPESMPHVFKAPNSAFYEVGGFIEDRKTYHNFDGCPPSMLMKASVRNGQVVFPSGATYSVLVLPQYDTCTPELLQKIYDLLKQGVTVVGLPPKASPSLSNYPACDKKVRQIVDKIWGNGEPRRRVGKGLLLRCDNDNDNLYQNYDNTCSVLRERGVLPDFEEPTGKLRCTHRTTDMGEIYFVANRMKEEANVTCSFRVTGMKPELWNPMTGEIIAVDSFVDSGTTTTLQLSLDEYSSVFVVFSKNGTGGCMAADVRNHKLAVANLTNDWKVTFDAKWGEELPLKMEQLTDWTQMQNPKIKYYSGTAIYERSFVLNEHNPKNRYELDLGEVCNMAHVWVNGQDLGIVWVAPWKVDVTRAIQVGTNTVRIEVVNLWQNRIIGDERQAAEQEGFKRYTHYTWSHYSKDDPLLPSGLLGPVVLNEIK